MAVPCHTCLGLNGGCPACRGELPVASGTPGEVPIFTPEQIARVQAAVQRDKAYADARAIAARLRKHGEPQNRHGHGAGYPADEVEILIAYFLDHA